MSKIRLEKGLEPPRWPMGRVYLTPNFIGSWLCITWLVCGLEVLTMLVALFGNASSLHERLTLILCEAKAVDMFICITLVFLNNCRRYGYDDERRRGLHPLHRVMIRIMNPLTRHLGSKAAKALQIFLVFLPTAIFTIALFMLERTQFAVLSRYFSLGQIALIAILYLLTLIDRVTYSEECKPQYPDVTFRQFVSIVCHR